jgi:hypothetical protein
MVQLVSVAMVVGLEHVQSCLMQLVGMAVGVEQMQVDYLKS